MPLDRIPLQFLRDREKVKIKTKIKNLLQFLHSVKWREIMVRKWAVFITPILRPKLRDRKRTVKRAKQEEKAGKVEIPALLQLFIEHQKIRI